MILPALPPSSPGLAAGPVAPHIGRMKRFWDTAAVLPQDGGFGVTLDGKPVRLPGGAPLLVPNEALAVAVAGEWNAAGGGAKGGEMQLSEVSLTRLAGTAQGLAGYGLAGHGITGQGLAGRGTVGGAGGEPGPGDAARDPAPMVDGIAQYGASDLLCYRAEEPRLAAAEAAAWQPLLDWAALQLDAPLRVTAGLMPVAQDPLPLAALRRAVAALPPLELVALGVLVPALGSLVLGLAVLHGRLDAAAAHELSTLDERFQEGFWGTDAEALARRRRVGEEVALAARLVALSRA